MKECGSESTRPHYDVYFRSIHINLNDMTSQRILLNDQILICSCTIYSGKYTFTHTHTHWIERHPTSTEFRKKIRARRREFPLLNRHLWTIFWTTHDGQLAFANI
jgi:hypothetical protein